MKWLGRDFSVLDSIALVDLADLDSKFFISDAGPILKKFIEGLVGEGHF